MPWRTRRLLPIVIFASLLLGVTAVEQVAAADTLWIPRIAIVWPHDSPGNQTAVAGSSFVNVSVWPPDQVNCRQGPNPPVDLFVAKNNDPASSVGIAPQVLQRSVTGVSFPSLEFDNVPANLAADPTTKYTFVSFLDGNPTNNVWVHAADPRTYLPHPLAPTGYSQPSPKELDTRIQIVWPHDEQGNLASVDRATRVNIAIDVFAHGTTLSVPPDSNYTVRLWWNQGNDNLALGPGYLPKTSYTVNGQTYPRWVVNDFPVRPDQQYHFLAMIGSLGQPGASYPAIWTHGADARTYFPSPQVPPSCSP